MKTKIAPAQPAYEGCPKLRHPGVYGASPQKPFFYRIPATGTLPLKFECTSSLPYGLTFDTDTGIISGCVSDAGEYHLKVKVTNFLGSDEKMLCLRISEGGMCRTPLLGWTSWNAFRKDVTQEDIEAAADLLVSTGLAMYGYQYVNIDSGWQGEYGGSYDAIQPNTKFHDMKALADHIHAKGLKIGIYSTPMQKAWGGGEYPGCTRGKLDKAYVDAYYGIGLDHCESNNVEQWVDWGIDYLKYDWSPCDIRNASIMKDCLLRSKRDFAYCITVKAGIEDVEYWKKNCSSWRDNADSDDIWENIKGRFLSDHWAIHSNPGHFFDLDMMETGFIDRQPCRLTKDEQLVSFSIRALFPSPIQLSCDLTKLTDFDLAMLCNEEILAVNQDTLGIGAVCVSERNCRNLNRQETAHTKIYVRPLQDGTYATGFFNLGDSDEVMTLNLSDDAAVRDLWAKEELAGVHGKLTLALAPHTVRMLKISGCIFK